MFSKVAIESERRAQGILKKLLSASCPIRNYVVNRTVPAPFCGSGEIRLIILGQDPTVKNREARSLITTVLNLNRRGSLRSYISRICDGLGVDLDTNMYATNVVKNFFTEPPTTITGVDALGEASGYWLDLLKDEVNRFPDSVILSLGEPVLSVLVSGGGSVKVRDYWGYTRQWKVGEQGEFRCIERSVCVLGRSVFPFPHQPSISKRFYMDRFNDYLGYIRRQLYMQHNSFGRE